MCKISLSLAQKKIATLRDGALLVRASAGSGKTRVLVERIKMLAANTKRKVLAITFTNKACDEIRTRLVESDENLLEHVFVSTFHGLCETIIENHISATRFDTMPQIFTEDDRKKILEETINENPWLNKWYSSLKSKERVQKLHQAIENISLIKRSVILDDDLEEVIKDIQMRNLYLSFREHMSSLNGIDFDDLLLEAYRLLINNPKIASLYRRDFEYICVDEAQDMNKAQYMILRAITGSEHKNIMLVGDTKQSIYAFNGSSSKYMDDWFIRDYSPFEFDLMENYRSAKVILDYSQKIVNDKTLNITLPYNGILKEFKFETPCDEAKGVLNIIQKLINSKIEGCDGLLKYSDIAILARNRFVLGKIEEELKQRHIPYFYKTTGSGPAFTSSAAKAFDLAIVVKSNPLDRFHLDALQATVGVKNCKSLQEIIKETKNTFLKEVISKVMLIKEDCSNLDFLIKSILMSLKQSDASQFNKIEEAVETYDEFELLRTHWVSYAKNVTNWSLPAFRNAMTLGQTGLAANETDGVVLSTIHTMKGQQAVVVFLVGMDEGTFPDYRAINKGRNSIDMQQESNNLYVAITRAQRHLYISYPQKRMMPWGEWSNRERSSLLP